MHPLKLAILGGGSFYVPSFVATICRYPAVFAAAEVRLTDVNRERVNAVRAFGEQYSRVKGVPVTFKDVPDWDCALDGADYVVVTFRIGGEQSTILDESIPPDFGYYGDETVGPGGMFMAMRTVPAVVDVARKMERLCPDAWLVNYANPTNFIADGVRRTTRTRVVSLCDGFCNAPADIGACFGLHMDEVQARHAGVNHFGWATRATHKDRNLLDELRRTDPAIIRQSIAAKNEEYRFHLELGYELFQTYGVYPCPLGHMNPYFYHDVFLDRQLRRPQRYHTIHPGTMQNSWNRLARVNREFNEQEADDIARTHDGKHADLAIGVIASLAADSGGVFAVNRPNTGALAGVPRDTIVETYAVVDRHGFTPLCADPLPPAVLAWVNHLATYQELVVQGILDHDLHTVFQALCLHPFTKSVIGARALFAAMLERERAVMGPHWENVPKVY